MSRKPDIVSPDTLRAHRLPPRQGVPRYWPVLHAGAVPRVSLDDWTFRASGLVEAEAVWSWEQFRALPSAAVLADMHCVTHWSVLDNLWEGVTVREVMRRVRLRPEAGFMLVHAEGGYTTNLPLGDFLGEDCVFAWGRNGEPLSAEHGGPLRLVVPRLYAWKSAKWVRGVEFLAEDRPGFWERSGYHNHGDPWKEERTE
jgi:DMSO/TMAO reductase YedYZ molybdopterin-dependent catalytic subunit